MRFFQTFCFLILTSLCLTTVAQPPKPLYMVMVSADHPDWTYHLGEKVKFTISVSQHNNELKDCKVNIQIGLEQMTPVINKDEIISGPVTIDGGTLKEPGFLRCIVTADIGGKKYRGLATAAFDPKDIKPTTEVPDDFQSFWDKAMADNAKIPMDPKLTLLPERCTEKTNVYQLNLQNFRTGSRFYGILCVPKKPGKYPAVLETPGAGIRSYNGDIELADKGVITLQIGIHGIPVILPDNAVYYGLAASGLSDYPFINLDNKDKYYYKRVYMGCIRANDYLCTMPEFNGDLAVYGGSQGGILSIMTAGLDKRVKYMVAMYPAMSDLTGYLHGRAGGWPHMFNKGNAPAYATPEKINTSKYYDAVNFAKLITIQGFFTWGYNDETCPPTTAYAAYNSINAPKELWITQESGHWMFPETQQKITDWLVNKLIVKKD